MATLTDAARTGGYIVSESNGHRSRETVTVTATGGALVAGTIMGKITASSKYVVHDDSNADGSQVAVAVLYEGIGTVEAERVVTIRDAEVSASDLVYDSGGVVADIDAELATVGIIVR